MNTSGASPHKCCLTSLPLTAVSRGICFSVLRGGFGVVCCSSRGDRCSGACPSTSRRSCCPTSHLLQLWWPLGHTFIHMIIARACHPSPSPSFTILTFQPVDSSGCSRPCAAVFHNVLVVQQLCTAAAEYSPPPPPLLLVLS